jgi:alkylation response protein AidB-like acyl-CoA dehydrogenase
MNVDLTEEQEFFRDTTRRFIETEVPLAAVRGLYDCIEGFDRGWWKKAAALGWTSPFVPDSFGGGSVSGNPTRDAAIVAEQIGRLVSPGPFLPVNVVAAAVTWHGTEAQRAGLLPDLLAGETIASWAHAEPGGCWQVDDLITTAAVEADTVVLNGEKAYVEAAGAADNLLVTARMSSGMTLIVVPATASGLTLVRGRSVDITRRFGRVSFDEVRLPPDAVLGEVGGAAATVERLLTLAIALQCAEMVGIADRTFEFTLEYGRNRIAFGRPIVSFQALKHRIADMAVWLEGSKALADELASAVDEQRPDALILASAAKAYIGQHCPDIVDDCVQIAGGMGVTWEHDIHLYSRRAVLNRSAYGTPEEHKERLVALIRGDT